MIKTKFSVAIFKWLLCFTLLFGCGIVTSYAQPSSTGRLTTPSHKILRAEFLEMLYPQQKNVLQNLDVWTITDLINWRDGMSLIDPTYIFVTKQEFYDADLETKFTIMLNGDKYIIYNP
jgi:hypothetical protein